MANRDMYPLADIHVARTHKNALWLIRTIKRFYIILRNLLHKQHTTFIADKIRIARRYNGVTQESLNMYRIIQTQDITIEDTVQKTKRKTRQ